MKKYLFLALILFAACDTTEHVAEKASMPIPLGNPSADSWTYYSLRERNQIGTSPYGDAHQDSVWYERTDWDFALCGKYIRTNGGTSGKGHGALGKPSETLKQDTLFENSPNFP